MGRPKGSKNKVKLVNEREENLEAQDSEIQQEMDSYKLENQKLKNTIVELENKYAELENKYKRIFKRLQSKENNLE